jgi:hypothetical protein
MMYRILGYIIVNIVATMQAGGVQRLLTNNPNDFAALEEHIAGTLPACEGILLVRELAEPDAPSIASRGRGSALNADNVNARLWVGQLCGTV